MLDIDSYALPLIVSLSAVFIVWFIAGNEINRRRMAELLQWLWRGARPYLGKASYRTLGTNAFHLYITEARPPFASLTVAILLESRDMPTVWLLNRLRGRTDIAVFRCELARKPIWGLEAFRRGNVLTPDAMMEAEQGGWAVQAAGPDSLLVAHGGGKASELADRLLAAVGEYRPRLLRLSVRRQSPHLQLALSIAGFRGMDSHAIFSTLDRLAKTVGEYST